MVSGTNVSLVLLLKLGQYQQITNTYRALHCHENDSPHLLSDRIFHLQEKGSRILKASFHSHHGMASGLYKFSENIEKDELLRHMRGVVCIWFLNGGGGAILDKIFFQR